MSGLNQNPAAPSGGDREALPISALNQYLFCPRRAALIHTEGVFQDNEHTLRGDIVHEHSDLAGYEVVKGVTLLRALPVFSQTYSLIGKCDIVEKHRDGSLLPVEFKLGKRRKWQNDDAQLCAQALCLEEMTGTAVPHGAVFHADSKRRRDVELTPELRQTTIAAIFELHDLFASGNTPRAQYRPACEECSLLKLCLPKITSDPGRAERAARALFID